MADRVEVNRAAGLERIAHGFLGRTGGVSSGLVAGLNVGFGADDNVESVAKNRRLALDTVAPGAKLAACHQIHSPDVVIVDEPWGDDARPHADAMVTDRAGIALGIVTADCAPILLADGAAGIVGAAHAGWRGAHGGVAEATVAAMCRLGAQAERIVAAIGPCIAQASYEVDDGFREQFASDDAQFFAPGRPGHWQFDLEAYVAARLHRARVGTVERLGLDTYAAPDRFFSFRRATHRGEPTYGRQFSLIANESPCV